MTKDNLQQRAERKNRIGKFLRIWAAILLLIVVAVGGAIAGIWAVNQWGPAPMAIFMVLLVSWAFAILIAD